jgi:hypothetical protein
MASSINAITTGSGGVVTTADNSGNLNIQSGGTTVAAITSAGLNVVGTLTVNGAAPASGKVLQVVQSIYTTEVTNSTSTLADTGLSASITPTSASSKILVLVTQSCRKNVGNSNSAVDIKLLRGATDLGYWFGYAIGYNGGSSVFIGSSSFQYLDSPATTSSTTYKTQFRNDIGAASVAVQADGLGASTITLLEIAA